MEAFLILIIICFLDTRAYKAAISIQNPVETVYEDMNSDFARAEHKRKWVESLVRIIPLNFILVKKFLRLSLASRSSTVTNWPVG